MIQIRTRKVDNTINGMDIPSTPNVNFKLSLLNQLNELTNWKCGISVLKLNGRYKERIKLLKEVQIADFLHWTANSSLSVDIKIKKRPIKGKQIKIGRIGRFIIRKYMYKD